MHAFRCDGCGTVVDLPYPSARSSVVTVERAGKSPGRPGESPGPFHLCSTACLAAWAIAATEAGGRLSLWTEQDDPGRQRLQERAETIGVDCAPLRRLDRLARAAGSSA